MSATFAKLALLSALATVTASTLALEPTVTSIDPCHGKLAAAQQMVLRAFERIGAAQQIKGFGLGGMRHEQEASE